MQILNLNGKRIADLSDNGKTLVIKKGNCLTFVMADKDGKLIYVNKKL